MSRLTESLKGIKNDQPTPLRQMSSEEMDKRKKHYAELAKATDEWIIRNSK